MKGIRGLGYVVTGRRRLIQISATIAGVAMLGGCTQPDRAAASAQLAQLCVEAQPLVPAAGPVAPFIEAVCLIDGGIARIEADPQAVEWFQGVIAKARAVAGARQ